MFETLTERLNHCLRSWTGRAILTEENVQETLNEVKKALLEADVSLAVVKQFIQRVKDASIGQQVDKALSPGQFFIKIVNEQLVDLMGKTYEGLDLRQAPPAIILMAGLQGSGKTTSAAKLALQLKEEKKSVCLVSCDVYRPAAILQLQRLAQEVGVDFIETPEPNPVRIAEFALAQAKKRMADVLIVDTAGRLHIDAAMMAEVKDIHAVLQPIETLFVVDSMTGQDATNAAQAFNQALPLTGVILTKTDGDSRGGAALSIREVTGKPIKFLGVGEKIVALEPFHPERMASRILGMGDVLTLIEEMGRKVDKGKAEALAKKIHTGKSFNLEDFREQLKQMMNLGGMSSMLDKMPGMGMLPKEAKSKVNDKSIVQMIAVIDSMTKKERRFPLLINGSRKRRIAAGAGVQIPDVNKVLKQHGLMGKMVKKMAQKGGMTKMMRALQGRFQGFTGLPNG